MNLSELHTKRNLSRIIFPQKKENISVNFVLANLKAVCTCHFFRGLYYPGMPGEERPRGDEVRSLFLITNLNDFTRKKWHALMFLWDPFISGCVQMGNRQALENGVELYINLFIYLLLPAAFALNAWPYVWSSYIFSHSKNNHIQSIWRCFSLCERRWDAHIKMFCSQIS